MPKGAIAISRNILRTIILRLRWCALTYFYGMDIAWSARVSWGTRLDKTNPRGIYIGWQSYCASGSIIMTHDYTRDRYAETHIGRCCFIGAHAILMPGITIGDSVIVGAGSVVTKSVPSGTIVVGNPARVLRQGIVTGRFGKIVAGVREAATVNQAKPTRASLPRTVAPEKPPWNGSHF